MSCSGKLVVRQIRKSDFRAFQTHGETGNLISGHSKHTERPEI